MPHHVVQRGNDRQSTFFSDSDYEMYLEALEQAADEFSVAVHAYVLMTNHVHLLLTPPGPMAISMTMQSLGRRYVRYVNTKYARTGTLWEGRFRCCVVDSDRYCLACYRYIELNPTRAGIVDDPARYRWSSFRSNALGKPDRLLVPHPAYLALAPSQSERMRRYGILCQQGLKSGAVQQIRTAARKGLPLGDDRFRSEIERQLGFRVGSGKVGRPARGKLDPTP